VSLCVIVDDGGNANVSSKPAGGARAWHSTNIDHVNQLHAVACPSTELCVAVDNVGNVIVGAAFPPVTACGVPYTFSLPHRIRVTSGSCAGLIGRAAPSVVIHRGDRFSVEIAHEHSGKLGFPVPMPTTSAVRIVSRRGTSVRYRAQSLGAVRLISHHTRFCTARDPRLGDCAALRIRIEP
jgi:hypothetical protein